MTEAKHTPLPWIKKKRFIYALNDQGTNRMHIAFSPGHTSGYDPEEMQEANVEFIIRAVNNHDALVEALESANEKLIAARDTLKGLSEARYPCPEEFAALRHRLSSYIETIRPEEQALAKAKAES